MLYEVPTWRQWRDPVAWYLPTMIVLLVAMWTVRQLRLRNTDAETVRRRQQRRVVIASTVVLAHVLTSLTVLGLIGDLPARRWNEHSTWVMSVTVLQPMLGAAIALTTVVWATPTKDTWDAAAAPPAANPARRHLVEAILGTGWPFLRYR